MLPWASRLESHGSPRVATPAAAARVAERVRRQVGGSHRRGGHGRVVPDRRGVPSPPKMLCRRRPAAGRPANRLYLLGGLLTCGQCGRRMHGNTVTEGARYRCGGRLAPEKADWCHFSRNADALDARVWDALVAVILDPDTLRFTAKASILGIDARRVDAATEHVEQTRALAKVTASRNRLLDLYVDGRLDRADLDAREPGLKAEIERLTRAVAEARARLDAGHADANRHAALVRYCTPTGDDAGAAATTGKVAKPRRGETNQLLTPMAAGRRDAQAAWR